MIFSISDHIQQIIDGKKTQTRRPTDRYQVGKTYSIQPGRGKKGIPEGRIEIIDRWKEAIGRGESTGVDWIIPAWDAKAEGGYTTLEYETLYRKMYPDWMERWAYEFKFIPSDGGQP